MSFALTPREWPARLKGLAGLAGEGIAKLEGEVVEEGKRLLGRPMERTMADDGVKW